MSIMGSAMNLDLWIDVYYMIIQSLEVLSWLDNGLIHAMDTWPH